MSQESATLWHQYLDLAMEVLIYAVVFMAAWGFGATQHWVIRILNQVAWLMAGLVILRRVIYWSSGWEPGRWGDSRDHETGVFSSRFAWASKRGILRAAGILTLAILGYLFLSGWNARASLMVDSAGRMEYRMDWIPWLPHSYDAGATWMALENYTAVAVLFWAAWDWLRGKTIPEQDTYVEKLPERLNASIPFIPQRIRKLLWFVCGNGAALALASILQRLSGTNDLLWLMPGSFGSPNFHFGPFNYRANGAQYFNLIWPLCLAFWWLTRIRHHAQTQLNERAGTGPHAVLFPFAVLMGSCPLISTNRVGAFLSFAAVPFVYAVLAWDGRRRCSRKRLSLHALFLSLIGFGLYLGWIPMEQRLAASNAIHRADPTLQDRLDQFRTTGRLIRDHLLFGTGPYAYSAVHAYYLESGQISYKFAHNDWLQTLAEWGVIGSFLIFALGTALLVAPWAGRAGEPLLIGMGLVGPGLVMIHALIDFPFQIHGILITFALVMAALLALPPAEERT